MATFTIPQVQFSANVRRTLGPVDVPADSRHVQVTLTSSQWTTKAGQGSFTFGIELSTDGGQTWQLLIGTTSEFGAMGKGIYMPSIGYTVGGPNMTGQLRLFGVATDSIRIGCQIVIEPAA